MHRARKNDRILYNTHVSMLLLLLLPAGVRLGDRV